MKLEIIYQEPGTTSGCPIVYLADSGEFVVQGQEVDADTKVELVSVVPGETSVRMAPEVLLSAALRYADRGAR